MCSSSALAGIQNNLKVNQKDSYFCVLSIVYYPFISTKTKAEIWVMWKNRGKEMEEQQKTQVMANWLTRSQFFGLLLAFQVLLFTSLFF